MCRAFGLACLVDFHSSRNEDPTLIQVLNITFDCMVRLCRTDGWETHLNCKEYRYSRRASGLNLIKKNKRNLKQTGRKSSAHTLVQSTFRLCGYNEKLKTSNTLNKDVSTYVSTVVPHGLAKLPIGKNCTVTVVIIKWLLVYVPELNAAALSFIIIIITLFRKSVSNK